MNKRQTEKLVGYFGFGGSLRQNFSVNRLRKMEIRSEKRQTKENYLNNPQPHLLQVQQDLVLPLSCRPGFEIYSLPSYADRKKLLHPKEEKHRKQCLKSNDDALVLYLFPILLTEMKYNSSACRKYLTAVSGSELITQTCHPISAIPRKIWKDVHFSKIIAFFLFKNIGAFLACL